MTLTKLTEHSFVSFVSRDIKKLHKFKKILMYVIISRIKLIQGIIDLGEINFFTKNNKNNLCIQVCIFFLV